MVDDDKLRAYQERKNAAFERAMESLYQDGADKDKRMADLVERQQAWDDLFRDMRRVRDLMVEDNGGTHELDRKDPWLSYMIGRLDELIGHWDPDASPEEVELADKHARRPPHKIGPENS
jgi:hypothetical protein